MLEEIWGEKSKPRNVRGKYTENLRKAFPNSV